MSEKTNSPESAGEQASLLLINLVSGGMSLAEARKFIAESAEAANKKTIQEIPQAVKVENDPSKRSEEDEAAKKFTAVQLRESLDALGIKYPSNASKADLLEKYLNR